MPDASPPWIVCKFGGTSVSSRARWDTIGTVVRTHQAEGRRPFLVCSALQGVSDQLEALLEAAAAGGDPREVFSTIR